MKILIVDDEISIRILLEQTLEELEEEGVQLLFAENGRQALEMAQIHKPRLVFLDVMMPEMNGMEACAILKKERKMDNVFVVLLTAKGQEADFQRGAEAGADRYLTKPFHPDQILQLARNVLQLTG